MTGMLRSTAGMGMETRLEHIVVWLERERETETETERDILRGAGGTCLLFFEGELGLVLEVPVAPAFCFLKPKQD